MKNRFLRVGIITLIVYILYLSVFVEDVVDSAVPNQKNSIGTEDKVMKIDTILRDKGVLKIDTMSAKKSSTKTNVMKINPPNE